MNIYEGRGTTHEYDVRGNGGTSGISPLTTCLARQPQPNTNHMSTTQPTTDARPRTTSRQFSTRNAPRTFSPENTNPCPRMFADRWQVEPESDPE